MIEIEDLPGPYQLPKGWKWVRLGIVAEIFYGKGLSRDERSEDGRFMAYGSNGPIYKTDKYMVEPPALIIGRKGSIGAVHLADEKCWPIDTTYYLEVNMKDVNIYFLYWYLKTVDFSRIAITTTKPGLNRDDLRALLIPLPPLEEQKRIVKYLDGIQEKTIALEKRQQDTESEADKLKESILHKAFRGELTS